MDTEYNVRALDPHGTILFEGPVKVKETFVISNSGARLPGDLIIEAYDIDTSELIQQVQFHASGSQPISCNNAFEAHQIVALISTDSSAVDCKAL